MTQGGGGWWHAADAPTATGDVSYGYLVDDSDTPVPDPRSRRQPEGVHKLSQTFDPDAFSWTDSAWTGRPLAGRTIYEMHVGTFTPEGTLDSAIDRLEHLVRVTRYPRWLLRSVKLHPNATGLGLRAYMLAGPRRQLVQPHLPGIRRPLPRLELG